MDPLFRLSLVMANDDDKFYARFNFQKIFDVFLLPIMVEHTTALLWLTYPWSLLLVGLWLPSLDMVMFHGDGVSRSSGRH
jgi:hypothetical protein